MRLVVLLLTPLLALTGCYTYSAVEVHAFDAATHKPIPGLRIHADYARFLEFFPPHMDSQVTNADGIAQLTVCTNYSRGGNTVMIVVDPNSDYVVDGPEPSFAKTYRGDSFLPASKTPYRVDLKLLTIEEYRERSTHP